MSAATRSVARLAAATIILLATCACQRTDQRDDVVVLDAARVTAVIGGQTLPTTSMSLPLHWDVVFGAQSGQAELELSFARPLDSADARYPYMLFMTRIASAYTVTLNGTLLASAGALDSDGDRWSAKHPVGIAFPASLLADTNTLSIGLRGDSGRRAGVAAIMLGPAHVLEPLHTRAYVLRVGLTMAGALFSLMVSGFCLLLWLQQREKLYAWACIGEAIWALVVADVVLEWTPLTWPAWGAALLLARTVWLWALYMIIEQVHGPAPRLERRLMILVLAIVPLALIAAAVVATPLPLQVWRGIASCLMLAVTVRLFVDLRKGFSAERLLLASGILVLLLAGAHDAFSSSLFSSQFGDSVWAKYVGALLGMTIMWIVSRRFYQARTEALQLQASLTQRVEEKERELRDSFARLSAAEQARAVIAERERILRDMHDGVGANLATAMRQLESGTAPTEEVAATLRESLDHLKLSIDAMNLPAGDVNALLASLRYRLQPRIESAGLILDWQVDLLPQWPGGTDQSMRHLQFLLLEAFSNALQHASAKRLTLSAHANNGAIEIVLRDDGRGIGTQHGRGLQPMRERADSIGAQLAVEAATPGTLVRVRLVAVASLC